MRAWGTEISEADGFVADVDAVWSKACYADTSFLCLRTHKQEGRVQDAPFYSAPLRISP